MCLQNELENYEGVKPEAVLGGKEELIKVEKISNPQNLSVFRICDSEL